MHSWLAVLMDLDQTLIDSKQAIVECFKVAHRRVLGTELPETRLMALWGRPLEDQMAELGGAARAAELVRVYREHLITLDHLIHLYDGWPRVLTELRRRGYRRAVVTSKGRVAALRHLALHGLEDWMEVVVTAEDTDNHKPSPEPLLLAAGRLDISPACCLVIGDSPWDIAAARRAGMSAALAEWGGYDPEAFTGDAADPDIHLPNPESLLAICPPLPTDQR